MQNIAYNVFTLMECDTYYVVDVPTAPTQCKHCSAVIPNCVNCTSTTNCVLCIEGWVPMGSQCNLCSGIIFNCMICNSPSKCIDCMIGWPVAGGCTNVSKCISVVQNYSTGTSTCTACYPGFTLNSNYLCSCPTNYWVVMNYCTNIIGCIATRLVNSQVICSACDFSKKLALTNSICECMSGF